MAEGRAGSGKAVLVACRNFDRMAGGVERMATSLVNEFVERGWRAGLLTWDPDDAVPHYWLDARVAWHRMDLGDPSLPASWTVRARRMRRIRDEVARFRPAVIVGFQSGTFLAVRLAVLGLGIPVVAAERNSPDQYDYVSRGWQRRMFANAGLALAKRITVQLSSYRSKYPPLLRPWIVEIPNPVQQVPRPPFPNELAKPPHRILSLGRLSYQKNQSFLLRAFARIAAESRGWKLALVGSGDASDHLYRLACELEIIDRVEFAGATQDVHSWFARSAFLVMPSLWEGFPNALMEAFAHGVPAVGFRSTAGINELLVDGETGLLTSPNEEEFAAAMKHLIDHPRERRYMGRVAVQHASSYDAESIYDRWETLFLMLMRHRESEDNWGIDSGRRT